MPLRPIRTETDTLGCIHWRTWPPLMALEYPDQTGREIFEAGDLDAVGLQRFEVWERVCGLHAMDEAKCRSCEHVRRVEIKPPAVPTLVSMDGRTRTPIIDQTFASCLPGFRSHLMTANRRDGKVGATRDAAWLRHAREREK